MKKLFILFAAVCGCMMAQAQTIDAISTTQNGTTDWYSFGKSSRIDVIIDDYYGNPIIEGKIYDLTQGNVETAFGTAPLPAIREAAIAEIKYAAIDDKEEIDELDVDESAKSDAKAQIDNIVNTATATINEATNTYMINEAKTQAIADIHNVVQTTKNMWVTVRTDGTVGNWNTICLERDITAIDGATFWTVSGQDATSFILDAVTEPKAGQGYLIRFTATELKADYVYERWDIDEIKDGIMKWSAIRDSEDGTRFISTFTWKKIK